MCFLSYTEHGIRASYHNSNFFFPHCEITHLEVIPFSTNSFLSGLNKDYFWKHLHLRKPNVEHNDALDVCPFHSVPAGPCLAPAARVFGDKLEAELCEVPTFGRRFLAARSSFMRNSLCQGTSSQRTKGFLCFFLMF